MLNFKNKNNENILFFLVKNGDIEKIDIIFNIIDNININNFLTDINNNLLHYASFFSNDLFIHHYLLQKGINPFLKNKYNELPYHYAKNVYIQKYLMQIYEINNFHICEKQIKPPTLCKNYILNY